MCGDKVGRHQTIPVDQDQMPAGHRNARHGGASGRAGEGVVSSTILFDGAYRHLAEATAPLKHNMEVKLFVGAKEVLARTRVLGVEQIEAGQTGWLQLATVEEVAVVRGDRFIIRRPSPGETLGGGRVLDPHPGRCLRPW